MSFDPERHHRRSVRLPGYDYAQPGAYFVTICTYGRECLLGAMVAGSMEPSLRGGVVEACWRALPGHFPGTSLDAFVLMPNHVHGIIVITARARGNTEGMREPQQVDRADLSIPARSRPCGTQPGSLGAMVQSFKAVSTRRVNRLDHNRGHCLWQTSYYERIIRNERELDAIREYIANNPAQWALDRENA